MQFGGMKGWRVGGMVSLVSRVTRRGCVRVGGEMEMEIEIVFGGLGWGYVMEIGMWRMWALGMWGLVAKFQPHGWGAVDFEIGQHIIRIGLAGYEAVVLDWEALLV